MIARISSASGVFEEACGTSPDEIEVTEAMIAAGENIMKGPWTLNEKLGGVAPDIRTIYRAMERARRKELWS